jgi:hypothetical protein
MKQPNLPIPDLPRFRFCNPPVPLADLQAGDMVRFWNNGRYSTLHHGGSWSGESTIMTEACSSFWGFDGSGGITRTEYGWRKKLYDEFNSDLPYLDQISMLGVPGYAGSLPSQPVQAGFINVPKLAMTIFNYRTKQGTFAGANP